MGAEVCVGLEVGVRAGGAGQEGLNRGVGEEWDRGLRRGEGTTWRQTACFVKLRPL